jgi:hypothetical protein
MTPCGGAAQGGLNGLGAHIGLRRRTVDQELLTQNEYLAAENRILKAHLKGRLKLSDPERASLGEIGHRLGCRALAEVATVAKPETILVAEDALLHAVQTPALR